MLLDRTAVRVSSGQACGPYLCVVTEVRPLVVPPVNTRLAPVRGSGSFTGSPRFANGLRPCHLLKDTLPRGTGFPLGRITREKVETDLMITRDGMEDRRHEPSCIP